MSHTFQPGDPVEVIKSKRGLTGPGTVVELAFQGRYLVKMDTEPKPTVVLVSAQDMRKTNTLLGSKLAKR